MIVHLVFTTGHTAPTGDRLARATRSSRALTWRMRGPLPRRRLGRADEARAAFEEALHLTENAVEREQLERRLEEMRTPG